MLEPGNIVLVADIEQKMVGCALIQAMAGCPSLLLYDLGFDTATWQTTPQRGQRKVSGTIAEWKKYAEICNAAHARKPEPAK